MVEKRKLPPSDGSSPAKRTRPPIPLEDEGEESSSRLQHQQPRSDPVFGQRHAFPGLDDGPQDGELFYGPADDGLEYLRMVRSEARSLPVFFVAQEKLNSKLNSNNKSAEVNESSASRTQGTEQKWVYSDGVCAAVSNAVQAPTLPAEEQYLEDPQEQYYNLLRHRFLLLRSTLKCVPPAKLIAALDSSHPISLPADNPRARSEWTALVKNYEPQMVQLACMELDSVLRVLRIVTRSLSEAAKSPSCTWTARIAAWAWGLLGRCREVGEMGSEEVGELRDLGKRAAKILIKIREKEPQATPSHEAEGSRKTDAQSSDWEDANEAEEENQDVISEDNTAQDKEDGAADEATDVRDSGEAEVEALELAKKRLQGMLHNNTEILPVEQIVDTAFPEERNNDEKRLQPDENEWKHDARAMLDMIITIVGEFYGQRDLLEIRDIWEEDEEGW
ncbi:hypothetical protein FQN49_006240 [Arthroderma sp. PD_2]|nr:hypothetical protein FQN49_006240 [Arthroderma sp. PD_2]